MNNFIIGIDPGKTTGVAVSVDGELARMVTTTFWGAYELILDYKDNSLTRIKVVIEVPKTKANWHGPKAAHDVGRVCREAELLAEGIERLGVEVIRQHPQGKLNHEQFTRITGWGKRTNQHCRDAGMLIYGVQPKKTERRK